MAKPCGLIEASCTSFPNCVHLDGIRAYHVSLPPDTSVLLLCFALPLSFLLPHLLGSHCGMGTAATLL